MGMELNITDLRWGFGPGQPDFIDLPRLNIDAGSAVCLSGPSGSGKTSLLFLLAGLEKTRVGAIRWGDTDLASASESQRDLFRRRHIGMVFQDFHLVGGLSVLENVLLPTRFGRWSPSPAQFTRAHALLDQVGLPNPRQRSATLSRGEMQRLAVARALLMEPSVLIADEPTASLDADNESHVADLLLALAREHGVTLLLSSHQIRLKESADRCIGLAHGRIVSDLMREVVR